MVLIQSLFTLTTGFCGTRPIEHPIPNSAWIVITEEFSCGVSSQWTEVTARNRLTGARSKLANFSDIEEFKIQFTPSDIFVLASEPAQITEFKNQLDGKRIHYAFAQGAGSH